MSTVDLPVNLLRTFITVSDLGGYTKAAKVLHRTQSAISLQMKRLEELLGEKLLVHEGGTVNLTSYGKVLAGFARQILQLNDEAVARYRKTNVRGPLRIGLPINSIMLSLSSTTRPGSIWSVPGRNSPVWATSSEAAVHKAEPLPLVTHPEGCAYRTRIVETLNCAGREWRVPYCSPGITGLQDAVSGGLSVSALTRKTLREGIRTLSEREGFPPMEKIRIDLFYKHPRQSIAGLSLIEHLTAGLGLHAVSSSSDRISTYGPINRANFA